MKPHKCIDSETLADYLEGRLQDQARDRVDLHLSECNRCLEDLLLTRRVFHQRSGECLQAVPPEVTNRPIVQLDQIQKGNWYDLMMGRFKVFSLKWSRLLHHIGFPLTDALAPVRGKRVNLSDDVVLLSHSFTGMDAEIEIEKIDSRSANLKVSISTAYVSNTPVRVSLLCNEREVASYLINPSGVYFESVPFGRYSLVYTRKGANVGQYDFTIKAPENGEQDA